MIVDFDSELAEFNRTRVVWSAKYPQACREALGTLTSQRYRLSQMKERFPDDWKDSEYFHQTWNQVNGELELVARRLVRSLSERRKEITNEIKALEAEAGSNSSTLEWAQRVHASYQQGNKEE